MWIPGFEGLEVYSIYLNTEKHSVTFAAFYCSYDMTWGFASIIMKSFEVWTPYLCIQMSAFVMSLVIRNRPLAVTGNCVTCGAK